MRNLAVIFTVAFAWVVLYELNGLIFKRLLWNDYVTWIFLPSGIRLASAIILGWLSIPALFLGAMITYYINNYTIGNPIVLAMISALNPYLAVIFSRWLLKLDNLLTHLTAAKLLFISFISALFNSTFHQFYLHMRVNEGIVGDAVVMFYGDFFGSLITLLLLSVIIKFIKYIHLN